MPIIGATQIQPINFLESYARGRQLGEAERALQQQEVDRIRNVEQQRLLNQLYSQSMTPTGALDMNALSRQMITAGMGAQVPALQAQQAEIGLKTAQARKAQSEVRPAEWKQFREELAALPDNDQARYQSWASGLLSRAPWAIDFLAPELTAQSKRQMLMTADAALPKGEVQDIGGGTATIDPFTGKQIGATLMDVPEPEAVIQAKERVARAGAPKPAPSETERGKVVGKLGGEALVNEYNAASSAAKGLSKDYEALSVLRSGKPSTGITSELETGFNRLRSSIAGDPKAAAKVSDSQYLEALLGSDVFQQLGILGIGSKGLDTPAERVFLQEVISGTRKLDKDTLIRMAEMRAKYKEDLVRDYNSRVESGELDEFFRDFGRPKRTFKVPTRPAASEPSVVPQVGEIRKGYRFKGGDPSKQANWEKVK